MILRKITKIWRRNAENRAATIGCFTKRKASAYRRLVSEYIQSSGAQPERRTVPLCASSHFPSTHSVRWRFALVPMLRSKGLPKVQPLVEQFRQSSAAIDKMSSEEQPQAVSLEDYPTNAQRFGIELSRKQHSVSFPLYSTLSACAGGVFLCSPKIEAPHV